MKKQEELEKKVNRFTKIAAGILLLAVVAGFLVMVLTSRRKDTGTDTGGAADACRGCNSVSGQDPDPRCYGHTALCLRTGTDGRRRIHAVRRG